MQRKLVDFFPDTVYNHVRLIWF